MCVSSGKDYTAGVLGLSDTKQTMRATLKTTILMLALAGSYFTLTDGVSKLLHISDYNLTHMNANISIIYSNTSLIQRHSLTRCYTFAIYTLYALS